jgi:2-desacetyl-2-hydroxyethyl bacteriochlorophyllide A dehydrogenase
MAAAFAFWTVAPGHGEIREEALAAPGPGDVVVRAAYSGVSRGTEALVFSGRVPPSEYVRMRAPFQAGDFPGPVKYGYVSVGDVEEGPEEFAGQRVFVLYPHQTRYVVPAAAASIIPDDVPSARAILASNLETAINGLWDAQPAIGDRIAVIGAGTVGCLVAWLAGRTPGCRVELIDVNPSRARVAAALGVAFATPSEAAADADVVVHASGSPDGLALALRLAGFESRIVEMSWYGDRAVTLPLGEAFHVRRLTIASSQVSVVAPSRRARWDNHRRMQLALSLLADSSLDVLVTGESPFDDLPATMARLATSPGDTICHRIRYER